jgi:hypothetical protein
VIERTELATLAKSIARGTKDYVAKMLATIVSRLDDIEKHIRNIPAGADGLPGKPGSDGIAGKDGRDGRDGRDGKDGRDAFEVEILPGIDTAKSYPRGSWARHKGGMIRAFRDTDAVGETLEASGWSVLIDGIAGIQFDAGADLREVAIQCRMTSGQVFTHKLSLPVPLYKQVFKEGITYHPGDVTTYANSLWHCNKETSAKPGTDPAAWTLCVREGRHGKDGDRGPAGPAGKDGRPGRDLTQMGFDGRTQ